MYNKTFIEMYDEIYKSKNYSNEILSIINIYKNNKNKLPERALDIGCGTGNHTIELIKYIDYSKITGIDINDYMIKKAKEKCKCKFYNVSIMDYKGGEVDISISLFNVVNHINNLDELYCFFKSVYKNLSKNGMFFFDCFNGSQVLLDEPQTKHYNFYSENFGNIDINTKCELNKFKCFFNIIYDITIGNDVLKFSIPSTAWIGNVLEDLLVMSGFKKIDIYNYNFSRKMLQNDYKIGFSCFK